jgi:hypothetical protein
MHTILMNAVANQQPQRLANHAGGGLGAGIARPLERQSGVGCRIVGVSPEEAAYVREHLDEVQKLRSARWVRYSTRPTPRSATACKR